MAPYRPSPKDILIPVGTSILITSLCVGSSVGILAVALLLAIRGT
jgi:hypothetical protein